MNGSLDSNVFYLPTLPTTPAAETLPQVSWWSVLRARVSGGWWRLRLTAVEIVAVIRRPGRRRLEAEYPSWLELSEAVRERVRPLQPARVIDLESARLRLRPATR